MAFLPDLPSIAELNKNSSTQLTTLSEALTSAKEAFMQEYKLQQEALHTLIARKQREEQQERKAADPDYESKMQTVHYGKQRLQVPPQK